MKELPLSFEPLSIYHTTNDSPADAVIADRLDLIYDQGEIEEKIADLDFKIGPFFFF